MTSRTIKVDALARVEGEGSLTVRIRDGRITDLKFGIFEPPRFFEALLRGRMFTDAPDITARICGICPIAYMMGASQAMEDALGVRVTGPLRDLRRLIYCGEWIQSHILHVYMLHAPDFLGFQDSIQLAAAHPGVVEKALELKKIGNAILSTVGGRAIHPVNLRVGGFYRVPRREELRALIEPLRRAVDLAAETVRLVGGFPFPELERDYTFVALRHETEYPITEGRLVSNRGLDIPVRDFPLHFEEEHVAHSNALHGVMRDGTVYHVGPLARYALNHDRLSERARAAAAAAGLGPVVTNPFQSIVVRAVESLQACEDALALVLAYEEPDASCIDITPGAGEGHGCTEAPRGICYHRYRLNEDGSIAAATIVPPTSQNQKSIEADLWQVVEHNLDLADEDLKWRAEQAIRNYDPCISCATHFLTLDIVRD
ncbi:MAG: Ni/Fe hydrogenase subunit alpha [Alphaproteobacteria bacterium]